MLPLVCPHHLVVDASLQQGRHGTGLEDMIEPLKAKFAKIHERCRVDLITVQTGRRPKLHH